MTFNFPHWQLTHSVTHTFSAFNPIPKVSCANSLGNVLTTRLSVPSIKLGGCCFICNDPLQPLPYVQCFIWPQMEYAIQAPHLTLSRDAEALEKVQKLPLKFGIGLWHISYEAALQWLRLFSFTHQWIHVLGHTWPSGIPYGVHLHSSDPHKAHGYVNK